MIKKALIYGGVAGLIVASITIYSLYTQNHKIKANLETNKLHYEAQIAILKVPKEKIDENKEVIKIVYKDKKGDDVIIEKVVTKTIIEKEPVILDAPQHTSNRKWYISGSYGTYTFSSEIKGSLGIGAGYCFNETISAGLRYDNFRGGNRCSMEVMVRF